MGTYVETTLNDFESILRADKGWRKEKFCNEWMFVFSPPSRPEIQIKIYSGIDIRNGNGRDSGSDAIRIVAVLRLAKNDKPVFKAKRIHRTANWKERVQQRAMEALRVAWERSNKMQSQEG